MTYTATDNVRSMIAHVEALAMRLGAGEHGDVLKERVARLTDTEARQASAHLHRLVRGARRLRRFL